MITRLLNKSEEELWLKFVKNHPLGTIHQTPAWGHFQANIKSRGDYWIMVLEQNDRLVGGAMVIRHQLPKGYTWLYAARGPLINYGSEEHIQALLEGLRKLAKRENAVFLRIDPPIQEAYHFKGFHKTPHGFQPEHTLVVDLNADEADILAQMKQKGRYNIKLAEKKGVQIREADPKAKEFNKDIDDFDQLLRQTTERDSFSGHDKDYYHNMVNTLGASGKAKLYLAEYEKEVIAGMIATHFKDVATYYYGASGNKHRNIMAPYLLQWHAIREAKKAGFHYYDFLGIAPAGFKKHAWAGVTEFKKKFGGEEVAFEPAKEYAFKPFLYWLYRLYKALR